jgi:hypothetical protein
MLDMSDDNNDVKRFNTNLSRINKTIDSLGIISPKGSIVLLSDIVGKNGTSVNPSVIINVNYKVMLRC